MINSINKPIETWKNNPIALLMKKCTHFARKGMFLHFNISHGNAVFGNLNSPKNCVICGNLKKNLC